MENLIKVSYYIKNDLKDSKYLSWPQKYDDFIQDIIKSFDLEIKNKEIVLKMITVEDAELSIRSQEDLQGYIKDKRVKEFKLTVDDKKESTLDTKNSEVTNNLKEKNEPLEEMLLLNEICYNCTECSSPIIILSINDKENII